ncbi:hypothetical protein B0H16DRAFT_1318604 [Mycena metata]|uniref:Uncharacterized protein n=1 Tax=Mycena metata TaxID=1033252 RepID=A0AAD7IW31_9AGAR|nr:hypothetical protein B0H16DRAFT_1318604 [Mycena metata]
MYRLSLFEKTLITAEDDLLTYFLAFWDPHDIFKAESLSSVMLGIVSHYRRLVWDPDSRFQPWFRDPTRQFRTMLRRCGAIVTGSQMLQFFDRTNYPDSDMDIFLRIGGVSLLGNWLTTQGYSPAAPSAKYTFFRNRVQRACSQIITRQGEPQTPIRGVYNYYRYVATQTVVHHQKIQLVVVDMDPIHHVIFDFHSTGVMNFLSSTRAVSIFPLCTFRYRKSYVARRNRDSPERTALWRNKYRNRGFRVINKRTKGAHTDLILGNRTTGDRHCWTIQLECKSSTRRTYID